MVVVGHQSRAQVRPALDFAETFGADALLVVPDPIALAQIDAVVARAEVLRLPTLFFNEVDLKAGLPLVLGPDRRSTWRQAASYVVRLLKGAKIAASFVQLFRLFLGVSLKTAKALGIEMPASVLTRADGVIE